MAAVSALPKIHRFFVKLTHYTYFCDSLTNFGIKAHEITGNGSRLKKYLLAPVSALPKIHNFSLLILFGFFIIRHFCIYPILNIRMYLPILGISNGQFQGVLRFCEFEMPTGRNIYVPTLCYNRSCCYYLARQIYKIDAVSAGVASLTASLTLPNTMPVINIYRKKTDSIWCWLEFWRDSNSFPFSIYYCQAGYWQPSTLLTREISQWLHLGPN